MNRLATLITQLGLYRLYIDTNLLMGVLYMHLTLPSLASNSIAKIYTKICISYASKAYIKYQGFIVRGSDCDTIQTFSRSFEPRTKNLLNMLLGEGGVFIDVGANVGAFTLIASKLVGNKGLVIAFEPVPRNYLALLENLRTNNIGNVIAVPYALWDQNSYLELLAPPEGAKASAKIKKHFTGLARRGEVIRVRAVCFDDFASFLRLKRLDLMKVDVEGAEIEVLRGAWNSILNYRPYLIVELYDLRNRFKAFNMLKETGYIVEHIEEANYLFIPRV